MIPFSVLDLAPVTQGSTPAQAFANSLDLARLAERLGYRRYWLAEHHNMPGIASAATAVLIGHIAGGTSTIRVGAGGIMLPNHAPLQVAEQFGTLASLYPDRIDLGLGRAPGTDQPTARALRRYYESADAFPEDVQELLMYFEPAQAGQPVRAVPGAGVDSRLQPVRRAPRRRAGPALCVRLAFRAGRDGRSAGALPPRFPAVSAVGEAARDAGHQRDRGRKRCGSAAALHYAAAEFHQPAPRHAGADPAADRRYRELLDAHGEVRRGAGAGVFGGGRCAFGARGARRVRRSASAG